MASTSVKAPQKVHDGALLDWLYHAGDEPRELIVEAAVPRRKVSFQARTGGRIVPSAITSPGSRAEVLEELNRYLTELLRVPPTLLRAAGALAVIANHQEAQSLLEHPLVKAVRPNRRLKPGRRRASA